MKNKNALIDIISAGFVLLFVYAAISKIQDFEKFRVELGKSPVLNVFAGFIAISVPLFEIVIAILLVAKKSQLFALYASFTLMTLFSTYIVTILKFSAYIPCSCGGILSNMSWIQHLLFNSGFVVLGGIAIIIYPNQNKDLFVHN
ncbi:MauE/DoxX family redox-associated membrane protein [Pedobacter panaciterrae]